MSANPLFDSTIRHQVYLERLKSGEVNQFAALLKEIDKDLRTRLTENDLTDFSRKRLEKLLAAVDKSLSTIFDGYYDELAGHLTEIAQYEAGFESRSLSNEVGFETVIPAAKQVHAAVMAAPLSVRGADGGKLLEPFIRDWTHVERKRLVGAIRQGFFEGQTNFQIIQAIRGTKRNNFADGLLQTTSRNAEAIVRTSVQHVSSVARFETWKANDDVVTGYRWVSTLDSRTSAQCRSLDGQVFKLGKGPKPPIHIRCRSTTVAELHERFKFLGKGRTRAIKGGGKVNANTTYYDWLKNQSAEFQDDVLGKARGQLFRNGGLSAERFAELNLGRNFKPLTLAEMRYKEPLAFKKAEEAAPLTKAAQKAKQLESHQRDALRSDWMSEHEYKTELGRMANPRIKHQAEEYGLNQAEQVALGHYTGTGYYDINAELFKGDSSKLGGAADVLRGALDKLPSYDGLSVRRTQLPRDILNLHEVGQVVYYNGFTSSTYGAGDVFSNYPHRIIIQGVRGKQVDWISHYRSEKEILHTSPTRFLVKSRVEKDGVIEITLKELQK